MDKGACCRGWVGMLFIGGREIGGSVRLGTAFHFGDDRIQLRYLVEAHGCVTIPKMNETVSCG
jgi:hypothetical protein